MADADAQAPVILRAERGGDVLQAVVAARRAALLQPRDAGHQIELVVHHQHLVGRDLVETRQPADRLAGAVHEGLRLQQPHFVAGDGRLGEQRVEAALALQARAGQAAGQVVDQPEAGVVAGLFVFGAGIAEADDQTYGHSPLSNNRKNPTRTERDLERVQAGEGFSSIPQPHYCGGRLLLGFGGWLGISSRSGWGSSGFSGHVAGWYRSGGDGQVRTVGDRGHAGWQHQFADVQRVADVDGRQVDGDELWQVFRQARHFDFVGDVADGGAVQLDRWRDFGVGEVQSHFHVDLGAGVDALEVSVQDQLFERVDLEVAQQHLLGHAVDFQIQDRRVEDFFFQRVVQGVVVQRDIHRGFGTAVDDTMGLAGNAQAAARSGTLHFTFECDNFHLILQNKQGSRPAL